MFVLEEATLVLLRNMFKSRRSRCNFSFSFSFSFLFSFLTLYWRVKKVNWNRGRRIRRYWIFPWPQLLQFHRGVFKFRQINVLCEKYLKEFVKEVKNYKKKNDQMESGCLWKIIFLSIYNRWGNENKNLYF